MSRVYQNHVVDPNYFNDAIEEFAFDFDWYVKSGQTVDSLGKIVNKFDKKVIRGSLQSHGTSLKQNLSLNSEDMEYRFYCRSIFRINIGDFIFYKNRWLHVESVRDYDEWGVRSAALRMINLVNYKDFSEYLQYLNGEKLV